ncbi:MAG: DUF5612 domain-containing protein [Candidatus Altiarchaeota archaeon]|nr:DUF5612 domain-containing protein [Candidatus Altiarchaeota archaeon]
MSDLALDISVRDKPGALLHILELVYADGANIRSVSTGDRRGDKVKIYLELTGMKNSKKLMKDMDKLDEVIRVEQVSSFLETYGKRVIIMGGGAQVSEVAKGAISEADRHNIRGEKISVDTIPLVGEEKLESAVRAVGRLPRAKVLVLAGALMGGKVSDAVKEIREDGIFVISLNMAGSVPEVCDLVVTDPTQAGVMAVMAISDTGEFDIRKQRGKVY